MYAISLLSNFPLVTSEPNLTVWLCPSFLVNFTVKFVLLESATFIGLAKLTSNSNFPVTLYGVEVCVSLDLSSFSDGVSFFSSPLLFSSFSVSVFSFSVCSLSSVAAPLLSSDLLSFSKFPSWLSSDFSVAESELLSLLFPTTTSFTLLFSWLPFLVSANVTPCTWVVIKATANIADIFLRFILILLFIQNPT